jgi:hypothetical protein
LDKKGLCQGGMNYRRKKTGHFPIFSVFAHPKRAPRRTKFSVEATLEISCFLFASFVSSIYPTTASNSLLSAVKKQDEPSFFFI